MLEEFINCWRVCKSKHLQALQPRNSTRYYIFYLYTKRCTHRYKPICCDTIYRYRIYLTDTYTRISSKVHHMFTVTLQNSRKLEITETSIKKRMNQTL